MKMILLLFISALFLSSCNKAGSGAFQGLEEDSDLPPPTGQVKIKTFTPTANPVLLSAASSNITFAVSLHDGAGQVEYEFKLDGVVLQSDESPFYILNSTPLNPGVHTLTVVATNAVSSDSHTFNIEKNTPANVVSSSPVFTGSLLNCNQDTLTFNAVFADADSDTLTTSWLLDSTPVTGATPFTVILNTPTSAQLAYTPDCSVAGFIPLRSRLMMGPM